MPIAALTRIFGFSFAFALQLGAQEFEYAYDGSGNLVAAVVAGAPSVYRQSRCNPAAISTKQRSCRILGNRAVAVGLTYQGFPRRF